MEFDDYKDNRITIIISMILLLIAGARVLYYFKPNALSFFSDDASSTSQSSFASQNTTPMHGTLEERIAKVMKQQPSETIVTAETYCPDGRRSYSPDDCSPPKTTPFKSQESVPGFNMTGGIYTPPAATKPFSAPKTTPSSDTGTTTITPTATPVTQTPITPMQAVQASYFVQVKSSQDETASQKVLPQLTAQHAQILHGLQFTLRPVDLGDKGVWFRTVAGPVETKEAAKDLCEKLKANGLKDCRIFN